ncbi:MAG: 23S rRNA (pseudouridine(1915)-N(3))-methyltransferase RlmH [Zetaproteobacteria bacterium]|nr:23S rRNA (pseudouridine(1915)-N(3))-methyltransferase RlmH [Zetaproteobacteria bacterium]
MEFILAKIGRVKKDAQPLLERYQKRLERMVDLEILTFKSQDKAWEWATRCCTHKSKPHLVILDEQGKNWSSTELAQFVSKNQDDPGCGRLMFIIGDPHGLDERWAQLASTTWSLSKSTFPADIAWILLHEQIYRALCILNKIPYHHE